MIEMMYIENKKRILKMVVSMVILVSGWIGFDQYFEIEWKDNEPLVLTIPMRSDKGEEFINKITFETVLKSDVPEDSIKIEKIPMPQQKQVKQEATPVVEP